MLEKGMSYCRLNTECCVATALNLGRDQSSLTRKYTSRAQCCSGLVEPHLAYMDVARSDTALHENLHILVPRRFPRAEIYGTLYVTLFVTVMASSSHLEPFCNCLSELQ